MNVSTVGLSNNNSHNILSVKDRSASSTDYNGDSSHVYIRGYGASGQFSGIGFNWKDSNDHAPAVWTGVKCTSYSGHTEAEYIIATRDGTANANPTRRLTIKPDGTSTFGGAIKVNGGTTTAGKFGIVSTTTGGDGSSGGHFTNTSSSGYQGRGVYATSEGGFSLGMGIYCGSSGATTNYALYAGGGDVYAVSYTHLRAHET